MNGILSDLLGTATQVYSGINTTNAAKANAAAANAAAKTAAANAQAQQSSTMKLIVLGIGALVVVGLVFFFIKKK